jgi:hypothetical protein
MYGPRMRSSGSRRFCVDSVKSAKHTRQVSAVCISGFCQVTSTTTILSRTQLPSYHKSKGAVGKTSGLQWLQNSILVRTHGFINLGTLMLSALCVYECSPSVRKHLVHFAKE